jgi:xanthine/uracil/vitamin C permease (AzgA family)
MILIPLTYSITQGIIFGLLMYTVLVSVQGAKCLPVHKGVRGKFRDISPTLLIIVLLYLVIR